MTKVIALGVHNDDCEYSLGGTAKLLKDAGCDVKFVDVFSPYHDKICEVFHEPSEVTLGIKKLRGYVNAKDAILYSEETIEVYSKILREEQPDIAFIMWPRDNHIEHAHCARAQIDALWRACGSTVNEVYAYEVGPLQSMGLFEQPDILINITDVIGLVKECMLQFGDRVGAEALWREKEVSSQWRGHMAYRDFQYAEAFKIVKFPEKNRDFLLRRILEDQFQWCGVGAYYWGRKYYMGY